MTRAAVWLRVRQCAKAVVGVAGAALVAAQAAVPMSAAAHGWVAVAISALSAAGVYITPNAPATPPKG